MNKKIVKELSKKIWEHIRKHWVYIILIIISLLLNTFPLSIDPNWLVAIGTISACFITVWGMKKQVKIMKEQNDIANNNQKDQVNEMKEQNDIAKNALRLGRKISEVDQLCQIVNEIISLQQNISDIIIKIESKSNDNCDENREKVLFLREEMEVLFERTIKKGNYFAITASSLDYTKELTDILIALPRVNIALGGMKNGSKNINDYIENINELHNQIMGNCLSIKRQLQDEIEELK